LGGWAVVAWCIETYRKYSPILIGINIDYNLQIETRKPWSCECREEKREFSNATVTLPRSRFATCKTHSAHGDQRLSSNETWCCRLNRPCNLRHFRRITQLTSIVFTTCTLHIGSSRKFICNATYLFQTVSRRPSNPAPPTVTIVNIYFPQTEFRHSISTYSMDTELFTPTLSPIFSAHASVSN